MTAANGSEFVRVPVEPTHAMELALSDALASGDYSIGECLRRAIAAASPAESQPQGVEAVACYRWKRNGEPVTNWIDGIPSELQIQAQRNCDVADWQVEYAYTQPPAPAVQIAAPGDVEARAMELLAASMGVSLEYLGTPEPDAYVSEEVAFNAVCAALRSQGQAVAKTGNATAANQSGEEARSA